MRRGAMHHWWFLTLLAYHSKTLPLKIEEDEVEELTDAPLSNKLVVWTKLQFLSFFSKSFYFVLMQHYGCIICLRKEENKEHEISA